MYNISSEAKAKLLQDSVIKRAYISIVPLSAENAIIIDETNRLQELSIEDFIYGKDVVGGTIAKKCTAKFLNLDEEFDLENREIDVFIGIEISIGNVEYIPYGRFIINNPPTNKTVSSTTSIEALDYMIKFNKEYEDTLVYPCTLKDVLNSICTQCEVVMNNITFVNDDFIVENNQFVGGETCRNVLNAISQLAGGYSHIGRNNELYIISLSSSFIESEIIDNNQYFELEKGLQYGPVNTVILRNSQVEGENVTLIDEESITINGINELVIADNPFAYTQIKRTELITALFNAINGFKYIPFKFKYITRPYLDPFDKITIKDMQGNNFDTYLFNHSIKYNGGLSGNIETSAMTRTETKYQFIPPLKKSLISAEIKVDKALGQISLIATEQTSQSGKVSQIIIDAGKITSRVESVETDLNYPETGLKTRTNNLEEAVTGITNTLKETGGLNLWIDAVFLFGGEPWIGDSFTDTTNTDIVDNTKSKNAIYCQNKTWSQIIQLKNGFYTNSFLHKKLLPLANVTVDINGISVSLTSENWKQEILTFEVTDRSATITITSDSINSAYISDLMLNSGDSIQVWGLNQNETYTDTVKIGKGMTIDATGVNTQLVAGADGIRVKNKTTGLTVTDLTDKGVATEDLQSNTATISRLLIQNINGQVIFNNIGGV